MLSYYMTVLLYNNTDMFPIVGSFIQLVGQILPNGNNWLITLGRGRGVVFCFSLYTYILFQ